MDSRKCLEACAKAYRRVIQIFREEAAQQAPEYDLTDEQMEALMFMCKKAERIEEILRKQASQ